MAVNDEEVGTTKEAIVSYSDALYRHLYGEPKDENGLH